MLYFLKNLMNRLILNCSWNSSTALFVGVIKNKWLHIKGTDKKFSQILEVVAFILLVFLKDRVDTSVTTCFAIYPIQHTPATIPVWVQRKFTGCTARVRFDHRWFCWRWKNGKYLIGYKEMNLHNGRFNQKKLVCNVLECFLFCYSIFAVLD